jgi:regulator of RNase E activity RraA
MHLVEVGGPVQVGGLTISPGDLLVADQHGAIEIPLKVARDIPAAAAAIEEKERKTIAFYRDSTYQPGDRIDGKYP